MKFTLKANGEYAVEESFKPTITGKQNLVKVKACGICGSDVPRVFAGKAYHYPLVIGHEFSGVIEDSYDKNKIGKKVCIFPIKPCFSCENCAKENYANCARYDYYGSRCDGGMQDYCVCDDFNLLEIPDCLDYKAAAMVEPCAVCLHAVKKACLNKNNVLKVYGAGTIGLLCCMWARAKGVKNVYVFDTDKEKIKIAESLGFLSGENISPDVIIDASGAYQAIESAIKEIKPFGRLVLVGNAAKDMFFSVNTYGLILRKQINIVGSWNSDFKKDVNEWKESVTAISNGEMHPELLITHTFSLKDADKAFDLIKERKETYNKVMVVMQ